MKNLVLSIVFSVISSVLFAQTVITEPSGRVTVRNANDTIISQIEDAGSGAIAATFNDTKSEICIIYSNGKVFVKQSNGTTIVQLAEETADKTVAATWNGNNIIITTQSGQTSTKNALEWRQ